jgi:voltage-gated potassium channel
MDHHRFIYHRIYFRIISINRPWKYVSSFYGIIDLLAILPMYLSIFFLGTSIMTVVRSLRLLRLFKILNHPKFTSQSAQLNQTISASKGKIIVFILCSDQHHNIGSIMYVVEGKESGTSIPPVSIGQ